MTRTVLPVSSGGNVVIRVLEPVDDQEAVKRVVALLSRAYNRALMAGRCAPACIPPGGENRPAGT